MSIDRPPPASLGCLDGAGTIPGCTFLVANSTNSHEYSLGIPICKPFQTNRWLNFARARGSGAVHIPCEEKRPGSRQETEIENDFQKKCRKGAKFAAHTAFSAILRKISCLFSLALEFFTRFRGGSFQPLTHLSALKKMFCPRSPISAYRRLRKNSCTISAQRPASTPPCTSIR